MLTDRGFRATCAPVQSTPLKNRFAPGEKMAFFVQSVSGGKSTHHGAPQRGGRSRRGGAISNRRRRGGPKAGRGGLAAQKSPRRLELFWGGTDQDLSSSSRPFGPMSAEPPPSAVLGTGSEEVTADPADWFTSEYGYHDPGSPWDPSKEKGEWKWIRRLSAEHKDPKAK